MKFDIEWGGLHRVISGGQTGADQGGILAGYKIGVETGGVAPLHYRTDHGYNPLLEVLGLTHEGDYASRTIKNVEASDGTVCIGYTFESPGTRLTRRTVLKAGKPYLEISIFGIVDLSQQPQELTLDSVLNEIVAKGTELATFIRDNKIGVLNVAGNRELKPELGFGKLVITRTTQWIVEIALEILASERKLILRS